jgi:hypothetical protein
MKEGLMSTSHPPFTARIRGYPDTIFDLIADMIYRGQLWETAKWMR